MDGRTGMNSRLRGSLVLRRRSPSKALLIVGAAMMLVSQFVSFVSSASATGSVVVSIGSSSMLEGNAGSRTLPFAVTLSEPSASQVTVHYSTASGTAVAGSDFVSKSGVITIPASAMGGRIGITVVGDTQIEPNEGFSVTLSSPVGAQIGIAKATGAILNDDPSISTFATDQPPRDCVIRSKANGRYVSAELGYTGSSYGMLRARATTVGAWERYQCIALGSDKWAIESRANQQYTSAELGYKGSSYGMLRARSARIGSWETYTLTPVSSCSCMAIRAANSKFVSAELGNTGSTYGLLRARSTSVGPWEEFTFGVQVGIGSASVAEGNAGSRPVWLPVSLSEASTATVSVQYATVAGSALAGSDFVTRTGTVTIPAGQTTGLVAVGIVGDTTYRPNEAFSVVLSSPVDATLSSATGVVTILNDDPYPSAALSWGDNEFSSLGDPNFPGVRLLAPHQIGTTSTWSSVATAADPVNFPHVTTFVVRSDGTLWGWGSNSLGQLGDGTTTAQLAPEQIGTDTNWARVVASDDEVLNFHAFGIKTDGTLWGWGLNGAGVLGDGTKTARSVPEQIGTDTHWQSIASADDHTVAIKADGTLWAWGDDSVGQLGDGRTLTPPTDQLTPEQIGISQAWARVAVGPFYTLAIKMDGTLWAWGANSHSELGDGTTTDRHAPVQIGSAANWRTVVATPSQQGYSTLALRTDGTIWGWGDNTYGQLGDGTTTTQPAPEQIGTDTNWASIAHGLRDTYAIKTDGTLWAWGNQAGGFGNSPPSNLHVPSQVGTDADWQSVSTSSVAVIALKADHTMWGWGENYYGEVLPTFRTTPGSIATTGPWKTIGMEQNNTLAIRHDGTLWGWGYNSNGQIGDNTIAPRPAPEQIGTDNHWRTLATGVLDSDAIKTDGSLWAWGDNGTSELGTGGGGNPFVPTRIGTATNWKTVAGGLTFTVGLRTNGTLWAWGANTYGQYGNGDLSNAGPLPQQIGNVTTWSTIAAGDDFTVALRTDGSLWAWGHNNVGQLGDGTTTDRTTPKRIGSATDWIAIAARRDHVLALKSDGTLWSWGGNTNGELGDGTMTNRPVPTQIGTATDWREISAGYSHCAAVRTDGTLWAWGDNAAGQLGDGSTTSQLAPEQIGVATNWNSPGAGYQFTVATIN